MNDWKQLMEEKRQNVKGWDTCHWFICFERYFEFGGSDEQSLYTLVSFGVNIHSLEQRRTYDPGPKK